jgi:multidrug efflux pump subunit AcrB
MDERMEAVDHRLNRCRRRITKTQYQYKLVDVGSDELDHWASILLKKLKTLPQLTDVASDQHSTGRVLKIEVNRQLAQQLGINPSVVDSILYDAFGQRVAARIYTRLNQYFVILEVQPDLQLDPNALSRIYATSSSGKEVPLSEFAKITSTVAPIARSIVRSRSGSLTLWSCIRSIRSVRSRCREACS